ncbi:probable peptide/nitrate transporter At3g43790 isoform X2 [Syzygium oleosum]|uniref:probable peptide/nitrate transporter At3g43790 isoform X2 n=1 Tax=Syzygium oleosum TaxID=219896 RepID=UPI0024BBA258|nr:probable peptide/nitrate transporter At3g43790 isoform X2 [Syzygium oleosum]
MAEGPESSDAVPLFEKAYHASCPGCEVDRLKRERRGIPYRDLSFIWIVSLCTALPISSLFPFLYFMIRDFHIAKREEDIGFYAGFVGSSFMVGRALTSVFWGVLADRYGRKPVILIGTFSVVVLNTLFGLSTSFWMALCTRFLLGCFNSLLGTIRAYASEVSTEEHHALTLSVVSTSRGMGLIIGPAIGGFFAQPAEKYPGLFSQSSIFGRYPYFLPCLLISIYAAGVFISCWWLPETLHVHESTDGRGSCDEVEISCDSSDTTKHDTEVEEQKTYEENLLKNWPLMSTIIVYCVFSLQEIAYSEIFSLWAVSERKYGGLNFSSQDVGEVLAISGFGLLLFQLLLYPWVERILGPGISIPLLSSYPFIAMLSGLTLHIAINFASILRNALSVSGVTGIFILLNNAVDIIFSPSTALQPQHQRGAANGISMTAMSISKAFGPACGGALFSWAQRRQVATFLPGAKFSMISRISVLWFPALTLIEQNARTCAASCFRLIS